MNDITSTAPRRTGLAREETMAVDIVVIFMFMMAVAVTIGLPVFVFMM